jgi:ABC-2 type transport system ATP-binding protein
MPPAEIGYLPEERGLYREISVEKTLTYMGVLRGMKHAEAARVANEWLERLELRERKKETLDQLSKGNQQKVQFVASILHRPKFAILDEPFSGLDPVNQEIFLDLIRELRAFGMTILLSAHQMDLVQRLADRVLLVYRGRAVLAGTMAEMQASSAVFKKVVLHLEGALDHAWIESLGMVDHFDTLAEGEYAFALRPAVTLRRFLAAATERWEVHEVRSAAPSLHEIFLHAVNHQRRQLPEESA